MHVAVGSARRTCTAPIEFLIRSTLSVARNTCNNQGCELAAGGRRGAAAGGGIRHLSKACTMGSTPGALREAAQQQEEVAALVRSRVISRQLPRAPRAEALRARGSGAHLRSTRALPSRLSRKSRDDRGPGGAAAGLEQSLRPRAAGESAGEWSAAAPCEFCGLQPRAHRAAVPAAGTRGVRGRGGEAPASRSRPRRQDTAARSAWSRICSTCASTALSLTSESSSPVGAAARNAREAQRAGTFPAIESRAAGVGRRTRRALPPASSVQCNACDSGIRSRIAATEPAATASRSTAAAAFYSCRGSGRALPRV